MVDISKSKINYLYNDFLYILSMTVLKTCYTKQIIHVYQTVAKMLCVSDITQAGIPNCCNYPFVTDTSR